MIPFYKIKAMGQLVVSIAVKKLQPAREDYPAEDMTDEIWELLGRCWRFTPTDRPSVQELLQVVGDARKDNLKHRWSGEDETTKEDEMDSEYPQSF